MSCEVSYLTIYLTTLLGLITYQLINIKINQWNAELDEEENDTEEESISDEEAIEQVQKQINQLKSEIKEELKNEMREELFDTITPKLFNTLTPELMQELIPKMVTPELVDMMMTSIHKIMGHNNTNDIDFTQDDPVDAYQHDDEN